VGYLPFLRVGYRPTEHLREIELERDRDFAVPVVTHDSPVSARPGTAK
jgi:hypothetical protein